jgi:acetoin utilization deacetylase AcuC-like enzyme
LSWIHTQKHISHVKSVCKSGSGYLDPDTPVCPESFDIALKSAGAWLDGVDEILAENSALVLSRPPGHHAEADRAMGFCLFSNAALAAVYALKQNDIHQVAIFDWDVHHGNGTQNIVQSNPDIAYVSIHQFPFYPGTGSQLEKGDHDNVLNIPVPSGYGSNEYKLIFDEQIFPFINNFSPDILIISAGFDAHRNDPLAEINLEAEDFAYMTKRCLEIQPNLLLGLEGGYDLGALGESVVGVCEELM